MLINQYGGSGGDALPWMFRELGIGPLIGTRTWGGLIGIGGFPPLMDGGAITAPRWGVVYPKTGGFGGENKSGGAAIVVGFCSALLRAGAGPPVCEDGWCALGRLNEKPGTPR